MSANSSNAAVLAAVFAISGAAINMLQQQLFYMGSGDGSSMMLIVPTFVGMVVGGLVSKATRLELQFNSEGWKEQLPLRMKQMLFVSLFDVTSLTLRSISQNMCGSGMFTVIYAILPAFNGGLSYLFMGRVLSKMQWVSILIVIIGLAFSAQAEEDELSNESKRQQVGWGIVLGLFGTLSSSSSYLSAEKVFKGTNAPKEGTTVTAINGINDLAIAMPWLLFYTLPNRKELLLDPIQQQGYQPITVVITWLLLVTANAAHLNSCYILLQITESVTLTMLQGLRAVLVFFVSGTLFCSANHPEQCISTRKVICSMVVIAGVITYAKNTPGLSADSNKKRQANGFAKEKDSFLEEEGRANEREKLVVATETTANRRGSEHRKRTPTSGNSVV